MKRDITPFDIVGPALLEFTRQWSGLKLEEDALPEITAIAIDPKGALANPATFATAYQNFSRFYVQAPDYFLAALALVRRIWFKDSKRQRLKNLMASSGTYYMGVRSGDAVPLFNGVNRDGQKWTVHSRRRKMRTIPDREIADIYNSSMGRHHGDKATAGDVEQARRDIEDTLRKFLKP